MHEPQSIPLSERYALSPSEAGDYIGVCRQTIYNWLTDGRLRSHQIGRNRRIVRTDLEALMPARASEMSS